jgi:rhodanese-related sulfurtransferase
VDTASHSISPQQFAAALGRPGAPLLLDVRSEERFAESERILPGARRCAPDQVARFAAADSPREAIVYCVHGHEVGQQAAAELRDAGWKARYLQGGIAGAIEGGLPSLRKRPDLGVTGERPSRWITRERPKIDRIACPWLVARFIDPAAEFIYVPADQVFTEAKRRRAVAYDIPGAPISHEGELCSFDTLLQAFDLREPALLALATIVRGADTGRPELAAQSAGLLAISLGLSQLHRDDQAMLRAALPVYDALYAWCRDAQGETHNWNPDLMKGARP